MGDKHEARPATVWVDKLRAVRFDNESRGPCYFVLRGTALKMVDGALGGSQPHGVGNFDNLRRFE